MRMIAKEIEIIVRNDYRGWCGDGRGSDVTIFGIKRGASLVAVILSMLLISLCPVTAQAFQSQALPADRTISQATEASLSYLRMSPDLLAAAEAAPSGSRPWQFAQRGVAQADASTAKTPAGGADAPSEHSDLAEVGAKLSNPVSDIWALFTQFSLTFNDGDGNTGDPEVGFSVTFQPILSVPFYRKSKLIIRPTIPILFGQPVPQGFNDFDQKTGFADTLRPRVLSPPAGHWLLGLGGRPSRSPPPPSTHSAGSSGP